MASEPEALIAWLQQCGVDSTRIGHVWSYEFVEGRTHDGRKFRILSVIDEASRECLPLSAHGDSLAAARGG